MSERSAGYWGIIAGTGRIGWQNLVGLVVTTLTVWSTLLPLLVVASTGSSLAIIGGLWATCLLSGLALLVLFRFTSTAVDRGIEVAVGPSFRAATERPETGLALGVATFFVIVGSLAVVAIAPASYRSVAVGIGGFLLIFWYLLVGLSSPELGAGQALRTAIRAGGLRFARSPPETVWFLLLSVGATLVTGVTIVTLVLFLPGVLGLIAVQSATGIATVDELSNGETERGDG